MRGEVREVAAASARAELERLKAEGFNMLVDLTCVDRQAQGRSPRFDVIWRVMKLDADSGMDLWPIADWLEREVWDMFGVKFADRPGIKRLLMYEEFQGHPLRKDYPIAKRQPLIGPKNGEKAGSPSFNILRPTVTGE